MTTPSEPRAGGAAPTLRAARAAYFAANGFDERSYADRWVRLMAGPVPIYFPNSDARVRALRFHDLHHALTGYATTWAGEAEIGAWEVASDCADHYAAWVLNLLAMAIGLFIAPVRTWRAFVRGRSSRNLYRAEFGDLLLDRSLASVCAELGLDRTDAVRPAHVAAFAAWAAASVLALAGVTFVLLLTPVALAFALFG